ncbi:MAG TPA: hypothetical protein VGM93_08080 [Acidimicrobiales bacterium]
MGLAAVACLLSSCTLFARSLDTTEFGSTYFVDAWSAKNPNTGGNYTWYVGITAHLCGSCGYSYADISARIKFDPSTTYATGDWTISNGDTEAITHATSSADKCHYYGRSWHRAYKSASVYTSGSWRTLKGASTCATLE